MIITKKFYITTTIFATKLTDKFYNQGLSDLPKLAKSEAKKILNQSLFLYGINSEYEALESLGDTQEVWNSLYAQSRKWVIKHYPKLTD